MTMRLLFFFVLASLTAANAAEVHVMAAASLSDALQAIAPAYEKASGDKLVFNFAGSNVLARQIQEGAPADVFISADNEKMDALQKADLIQSDTRRVLLSNTLVIIVPADSKLDFKSAKDLENTSVRKIALAQPDSVPAGIYAREYLEKLGIWKNLEGKTIPTENVRAALAVVASGNVDAGIVYKTDAGISKAVKIAHAIPAADAPKISYPAAVVKATRNSEEAAKFLKYLHSEEAAKVFQKFGFLIAP